MAKARYRNARDQNLQAAAGNGLIDRRALLGRGMVFAGAVSAGIGPSSAAAGEMADRRGGGLAAFEPQRAGEEGVG
jgi:hypothetical protein